VGVFILSIGMVLGGAGTKAYVHLGALRALREAGVTPDIYSGASSGSIVGAFMAAGRGIEEAFDMLKTYKFFDFAAVGMPKRGLFNLDNLERNLMKQLHVRTFEDLKYPLYVSATNLYTGKAEYISSGPLIPAIKASCAIPFVFSPVKLNGNLYVDGGLMDNLPYTPLLGQCDKIIVSSVSGARKVEKVENVMELAARVLELIMNQDGENAKRNSHLYIEPAEVSPYGMLDTGHGDELFQLGYANAKKILADK
jgi:NTE family protein